MVKVSHQAVLRVWRMPVHWFNNTNAWMTSSIFEEYVCKWDWILNYPITLLLDNCKAHSATLLSKMLNWYSSQSIHLHWFNHLIFILHLHILDWTHLVILDCHHLQRILVTVIKIHWALHDHTSGNYYLFSISIFPLLLILISVVFPKFIFIVYVFIPSSKFYIILYSV